MYRRSRVDDRVYNRYVIHALTHARTSCYASVRERVDLSVLKRRNVEVLLRVVFHTHETRRIFSMQRGICKQRNTSSTTCDNIHNICGFRSDFHLFKMDLFLQIFIYHVSKVGSQGARLCLINFWIICGLPVKTYYFWNDGEGLLIDFTAKSIARHEPRSKSQVHPRTS